MTAQTVNLGTTPSNVLDALATQWVPLLPRLLVFARRRARASDRAHDFVQDAYVLIRTGHRAWDPAKQPDFGAFACGVIASVASHHGQSASVRREKSALPDDGDGEPAGPPSQPTPERLVAMKERQVMVARARTAVRESFDASELERLLCDQGEDGSSEESAESDAARHGVTVDRIYAARAKIKYAMKRELLARSEMDRKVGGAVPERRLRRPAPEAADVALDETTRAVLAMAEAELREELARDGLDLEKEKALVQRWNDELAAARTALKRELRTLAVGAVVLAAVLAVIIAFVSCR